MNSNAGGCFATQGERHRQLEHEHLSLRYVLHTTPEHIKLTPNKLSATSDDNKASYGVTRVAEQELKGVKSSPPFGRPASRLRRTHSGADMRNGKEN